MRKTFFYIFLASLIVSCQSDELSKKSAEKEPINTVFFDLESYFMKEAQRLNGLAPYQKTVSINGKTETQRLENFDAESAFSIFTASNINKTAWMDKYSADTLFTAPEKISRITYLAKEEDLATRKLEITYEQQQPSKIFIQKEVKNAFLETTQSLTYFPQKGYRIERRQHLALSDSQQLTIEVSFKN